MEEKPCKQKQKSKMKWIVTGIRLIYPRILFIFLFWLLLYRSASLCPVFQGLASECCRFLYNILISTETKQPPPDTSVFIGYPRPDEKKNCKKKTWAKYLKLSLSFSLFQDPDRKMRACGARKAAFSTKVNWLFWETRQHYIIRVGPCFPQR